MQMYSNEPWKDEQARQDAMEAYAALFPECAICGNSLVNSSVAVKIKGKFYCEECVEIMTHDEVMEECGID